MANNAMHAELRWFVLALHMMVTRRNQVIAVVRLALNVSSSESLSLLDSLYFA